jgi:TatD family-associated radical SAM protein
MSDHTQIPPHAHPYHGRYPTAGIDRDQFANGLKTIQSIKAFYPFHPIMQPSELSKVPQKPTPAYTIGENRYLNVTDRRTLACRFCPKHTDGPKVHEFDLTLAVRPSVQDVIAAIGDPACYREIVFCGFGEPTLRLKLVLEVSEWIKAHHGRVRLNTDGLANLVHKHNVLPDFVGRIDVLSISMNAQNEALYQQHCQPALAGSYQAMLDFIELAPHYVGDVTATAIDGLEGVDIGACRQLAEQRGVAFRRRVLDQVG